MMKKLLVVILVLALCGTLFAGGGAQRGGASGVQMIEGANVPRNQTLILENPGGRCNPPDYFNRWSGWNNTYQSGFQQIALDALWYIDPDAGVDGVWENALAAENPIYNSDFTQLTVKLRSGIYWSDGVEFTADDLIYTIEAQMKTPGMAYTGPFNAYVNRVEKVNNYEVKIYMKEPNSRFHTNFLIRWGACFIMPKHIFEKQADITTFKFNPPISLGPYTLKDYDPQGNWYLWEKRSDWQRTSLARLGSLEQAPKYAMYIAAGTSDVKVMSQQQHQLDVIHDMAPEGVITLKRTNPTSKTWFPNFPWGHPDPTQVACVINDERPGLNNKDVRWALALSLDITRLAISSYRGAMTISALAVPPTGMYPEYYHTPLEQYLKDYTLDLGDGTRFKPYNTEAAINIANEARKSLGDMVPTSSADIKKYVGAGWWKYDTAAATKLMQKGGMRKNARGVWEFSDGKPFKISVIGQTDNEPSQNRLAAMVVECWKEFGIDASLNVSSDFSPYTRPGDFDVYLQWNIETWGGHPDLSYFLPYFHSNQYVPIGEPQYGRNAGRWKSPQTDRIIDQMTQINMDDIDKSVELGQQWLKVALDDMFEIPICSYNVFTVMDEWYWTGYPDINNPYTDPVPNWANSRYMYLKLKPTGK
ncbi:MAG: ABC transporter substrate-binding protein [Treponema sp.]|jgi:peptide/nickel transport system substrate-binding protein|nr:ABC transporter substrate-binding protein [Treponema sp.]